MFVRKKSNDLLVAGKLFTFNRVLNGLLLTGNQGFSKELLRMQNRCGYLPHQFKLCSLVAFKLADE